MSADPIMPEKLELLLPHREPMRWVQSLDRCEALTATATVTFQANHFAVADGQLLETALVECVAQTVAAAAGHRAARGEHARAADSGVLAAVTGFRIKSVPPLGEAMQIAVRELTRLDRMVLVGCVVSCGGQVIASGNLKLYA